MFDLNSKKALVTGGSGGIGFAIAKALHAQGAEVALSGTRQSVLEENASQLGDRSHVVVSDLSNAEGAANLVAEATEKMGGIDILINNAGITRDNIFMRMKEEEWQQVMEVNLSSVFRLSRAVLRGMMKKRWGRIINITSVVGVTGNPGQGNYAAAKAGMIGMSKSLAQEVASRNITVNCIAPGFIETAMTEALDDAQRSAILGKVPAGRLGTVEEIAGSAVYLASEESSYVTGQTVHVNGGMAMI